MAEWPAETKRRIHQIIKELPLPEKGYALDFGCGNGVLTNVLHEALPLWKIYGTDISITAVQNARVRYPGCTFFTSDESVLHQKQFDFLFSHHVFEHVFHLDQTFSEILEFLKPVSAMLHILPCGNEGSYEHYICKLRKDGINTTQENRFFFEEEGHLRRLTSAEFTALCVARQFTLQRQYYSNHYYGAVNWITGKSPVFILKLTDFSKAVSDKARKKLKTERIRLLLINVFRLPSIILSMLMNTKEKHAGHYMLMLMSLPLNIVSFPFHYYWNLRAIKEWNTIRQHHKGSEMFLFYTRSE